MPQQTLACSKCGDVHDELSFAIPSRLPTHFFMLPNENREDRAKYNEDFCVIDEEHFYIYGSLEIPIKEHDRPFIWGVWAEVTEHQFSAVEDSHGQAGRESLPSFQAHLASDLPIYPPSLGLPLRVDVQPVPVRPSFEVLSSDHPLFHEQQRGVLPGRINEIREWLQTLRSARAV